MNAEEREALRRAVDVARREREAAEPHSAVKNKRPAWKRKRPRVVSTHSYAGYGNGCRCDICREAKRLYSAERRRRQESA